MHRRKFVLNTYGYQVHRKPKGPASLRESFHDESDQNLYIQTPTNDGDKEPGVSIPLTPLVEKEDEEPEMFINKAASESENGLSLSKDIAGKLEEGHEAQVLKMSFDEPGEETKLWDFAWFLFLMHVGKKIPTLPVGIKIVVHVFLVLLQ